MKILFSLFSVLLAITGASTGQANSLSKFEELMIRIDLDISAPDRQAAESQLADCSFLGDDAEAEMLRIPGFTQWIYNELYSWRIVPVNAGQCVYLMFPEKRGLTAAEGANLTLASSHEFPVEASTEPQEIVPPDPNATYVPYPQQFYHHHDPDDSKEGAVPIESDEIEEKDTAVLDDR